MYVGELKNAMGIDDIMGHEAIGIVEEVRPEVKDLKVGDRVTILPVPNWRVNGEDYYAAWWPIDGSKGESA
jgi:threonine dehydrogenase-like Zn-dependent dehydrogenase